MNILDKFLNKNKGEMIVFKLKDSPTLINCFEEDLKDNVFKDTTFIGVIIERKDELVKVKIIENGFGQLKSAFPDEVFVQYNHMNIIKQGNKPIILNVKIKNTDDIRFKKIIADKSFNYNNINRYVNIRTKEISKINSGDNIYIDINNNGDKKEYNVLAFSNEYLITFSKEENFVNLFKINAIVDRVEIKQN